MAVRAPLLSLTLGSRTALLLISPTNRADGVGRLLHKLASLQVTLRVEDVGSFVRACLAAGWSAVDSGERITTDDGVDKEAVLNVRIPVTMDPALATT